MLFVGMLDDILDVELRAETCAELTGADLDFGARSCSKLSIRPNSPRPSCSCAASCSFETFAIASSNALTMQGRYHGAAYSK